MKAWSFKVKSNPQELINKLDAAFGSGEGFVFKIDKDKNDSLLFNMRKRVHYTSQILHVNRISVNGKILKTETGNETDVEIYFTQHLVMILIIIYGFILGLIAIVSGIWSGASFYIYGGVLLAIVGIGIVLWIAIQKKFENNIQEYKKLISDILEL